MVSTDHMPTKASAINSSTASINTTSFFVAPTLPARLQQILIGFDPDRIQSPTCREARANCDVSVTMVSYTTCRVIECRLQIAIGTTDPKGTVYTRACAHTHIHTHTHTTHCTVSMPIYK